MSYNKEKLVQSIEEEFLDDELYQVFEETYKRIKKYLDTTNFIALNVYKYNEHGDIHSLLTVKNSLKILRILKNNGNKTTLEELGKPYEWSQFVVSLGALMHDLGNLVHREYRSEFSVRLAYDKVSEIVEELPERLVNDPILLEAFILNSIYTHDEHVPSTTIEGSVVKVADGCDMEEGRSRMFSKSDDKIDIHAISPLTIKSVEIMDNRDNEVPVRLEINMDHEAGVFQVDELLSKKIKSSLLENRILTKMKVNGKEFEKVI